MSKQLDNTLNSYPTLILSETNVHRILDEAWDLRGSAQPVVPNFIGGPGGGKTQIVYAWGKKMAAKYDGFRVTDVMLADKYPSDLNASIPNHDKKMLMGYINEMLAWAIHPDAYGVIFFDEVTNADAAVQKIVSKAVNEHKFGEFQISPNVIIVMAGNRSTDKSGSIKLFAMVSNRVDTYMCIPDVEGIVDYMIDKGYNPIIPAYMSSLPYNEEQDFQPNEPSFYTHRSMERVAQRWTRRDADGSKGVVMDLMELSASIGIGRARTLTAFASMIDKMPSRKEIGSDPQGCRVPSKLDEQCAVACMLSTGTDAKSFPIFRPYMERFPVSMQILYLKLVLKRNGDEVKKLKEFVQWVIKPEIKDAIMDRTA